DAPAGGVQGLRCGIAAGAGSLHSPLGRKSVEQMPGRVYADEITVVELRTYVGVALTVSFVAGENLNVRTKLAAVDQILSIFDLDIDLAGFEIGTVCVGTSKAFVQVRVERGVLQLSGNFKWRFCNLSAVIDSEEFTQSQIGISELRFGIGQLRLFVGQSDLSAGNVQRANDARLQTFVLSFQFFIQHPHRILADPNL